MFFKKFAVSVVTIASIFAATVSAAETKIGFVETRKVIESSTAHANILEQVQKKNEIFRDAVQKSEADLKKKYQDLETKKNALSQEVIDKKNEEISKEVAELGKKTYSQHALLEEAYRNATQIVVEKANEIVKKYAEKNSYNAVLDKGAAVYSDSSLNITEVVLEELNKVQPKVEVKFDEEKTEVTEPEKAQDALPDKAK
jgi:Skp family chaperone for outer membrane proteins